MPRGYPDWLAKQLEIWSKAEWAIIKGEYKSWKVGGTIPAGETGAVQIYTVPSGKSLFVTDITYVRIDNAGIIIFYLWKRLPPDIFDIAVTGSQQGGSVHFRQPAFVDESWELWISFKNIETTDSGMYAVINAYEIVK